MELCEFAPCFSHSPFVWAFKVGVEIPLACIQQAQSVIKSSINHCNLTHHLHAACCREKLPVIDSENDKRNYCPHLIPALCTAVVPEAARSQGWADPCHQLPVTYLFMGHNTIFTGCITKCHKQVTLRSAEAVHQHSLKRAGKDAPGQEGEGVCEPWGHPWGGGEMPWGHWWV